LLPTPLPRRYYLNGNDAYRLKLLLPAAPQQEQHHREQGQEGEADEAWVAEQIQRLGVGGHRVQAAAGQQPTQGEPAQQPAQQQQGQQRSQQQEGNAAVASEP
jgi:hypothetical protein